MRPTTNKISSDNQTNFSQTMKKVLVLTQLYTFLLLTCGTRSMQKKSNQPTTNMKKDVIAKKHFGYYIWHYVKVKLCIFFLSDLRAKLEVAIENVLSAVRSANIRTRHNRGDDDDDEDNSSSVTTSDNEEVR